MNVAQILRRAHALQALGAAAQLRFERQQLIGARAVERTDGAERCRRFHEQQQRRPDRALVLAIRVAAKRPLIARAGEGVSSRPACPAATYSVPRRFADASVRAWCLPGARERRCVRSPDHRHAGRHESPDPAGGARDRVLPVDVQLVSNRLLDFAAICRGIGCRQRRGGFSHQCPALPAGVPSAPTAPW